MRRAPGAIAAHASGSRDITALALTFLRLGVTAFGGPAAHIALMEHEFVRRRGWLTPGEFLDLVGAASLIPGPSSTEVAIYRLPARRPFRAGIHRLPRSRPPARSVVHPMQDALPEAQVSAAPVIFEAATVVEEIT